MPGSWKVGFDGESRILHVILRLLFAVWGTGELLSQGRIRAAAPFHWNERIQVLAKLTIRQPALDGVLRSPHHGRERSEP